MIDVSMLDTSLSTMASWPVSNYLNAGKVPVPMGNENHTAAPSGTFKTGKGLLNIVNNEHKQWDKLCDVIGKPELKTDPRFAEGNARITNRAALRTIIEDALQAKSAEDWERLFNEAGVPAGPILNVPDILGHPHVEHRQLIKRFEKARGVDRDIAVTRVGFRLSREQPDVDRPPPVLGVDTDDVLSDAGYSNAAIADLRRAGVI
jgi:formyl-CoA transferase